jgi:Heavy-metal resistance protein CzcE
MIMVRKLAIAVAATLLSSTAFAQGAMQDTWDTNAPNGAPMILGKPLSSSAASSAAARAPMQDTWDINAPNGAPSVAAPAALAASHSDPAVHGHAVSTAKADRVIEVGAGTRYVNVKSGETVLFKVGGKSFTWTFDETLSHPSFDLAAIAPEGIAVPGVRIYCAPTEYERAG